ncbi:hypothetical protein KV112_10105 [Mycolicibacter sp. MYC123]|uniref:Uncharacterized protein n=1 Tax=[Mycobacterium] zoologicum TaxID=2872311 RepID=A0ABU5YJ64_9MYCO|nr:hypothetical protein [Mycolicibacter sp. MYC123]MEB3050083.1 hypothetical protein [Mycolicibacter sp. MYC123]
MGRHVGGPVTGVARPAGAGSGGAELGRRRPGLLRPGLLRPALAVPNGLGGVAAGAAGTSAGTF